MHWLGLIISYKHVLVEQFGLERWITNSRGLGLKPLDGSMVESAFNQPSGLDVP